MIQYFQRDHLVRVIPDSVFGWVVHLGPTEYKHCWTQWGANRVADRIRAEQRQLKANRTELVNAMLKERAK